MHNNTLKRIQPCASGFGLWDRALQPDGTRLPWRTVAYILHKAEWRPDLDGLVQEQNQCPIVSFMETGLEGTFLILNPTKTVRQQWHIGCARHRAWRRTGMRE